LRVSPIIKQGLTSLGSTLRRPASLMTKPSPALRVSVATPDAMVKIRLYPADQFDGPPDLFRLKIGREWVMSEGKYTFFTPAAALEFAARSAGLAPTAPARPAIRRNDRVRVTVYDSAGESIVEKCFVSTPPFQGPDGRWRVFVLTVQHGQIAMLCDDVRPAG